MLGPVGMLVHAVSKEATNSADSSRGFNMISSLVYSWLRDAFWQTDNSPLGCGNTVNSWSLKLQQIPKRPIVESTLVVQQAPTLYVDMRYRAHNNVRHSHCTYRNRHNHCAYCNHYNLNHIVGPILKPVLERVRQYDYDGVHNGARDGVHHGPIPKNC